jgi:FtsH-binding integral membrane protein
MNVNPLRNSSYGTSYVSEHVIAEFIRGVYMWMAIGLGLTGLVAYGVATSPALVGTFILNRPVFYGLIIAELAIVFGMSMAINKISSGLATLFFLIYSTINGLTMSVIFLIYTGESIGVVFFITAGMFGALAAYGYATKRDLTSMGQFFFMGLVGLVIASVVNIFLRSDALTWAISVVGVVVFCGLTIYDSNKLKAYAIENAGTLGDEQSKKVAIFGALSLYLDFVNLFLMLLRLFGGRRD